MLKFGGTRTITTDIGMYLSEYLKVKGLFVSDLKKKYTYSERGANFDKVTYFYFIFFVIGTQTRNRRRLKNNSLFSNTIK